MTSNYTIKDFENFIYGCNGLIKVTGWDIKKYKPHNSMTNASNHWNEYFEQIEKNAHLSKTNIKHIIFVENNKSVIEIIDSDLKIVTSWIENFRVNYKMNHVDTMVNNRWFFEFRELVLEYEFWFKQLIEPIFRETILKHLRTDLRKCFREWKRKL